MSVVRLNSCQPHWTGTHQLGLDISACITVLFVSLLWYQFIYTSIDVNCEATAVEGGGRGLLANEEILTRFSLIILGILISYWSYRDSDKSLIIQGFWLKSHHAHYEYMTICMGFWQGSQTIYFGKDLTIQGFLNRVSVNIQGILTGYYWQYKEFWKEFPHPYKRFRQTSYKPYLGFWQGLTYHTWGSDRVSLIIHGVLTGSHLSYMVFWQGLIYHTWGSDRVSLIQGVLTGSHLYRGSDRVSLIQGF